ncbi:MAG: hypothetical protein ACJA0N_002862 [Pseudohongiellaceae bacterium]|jgi:hypothetical protein
MAYKSTDPVSNRRKYQRFTYSEKSDVSTELLWSSSPDCRRDDIKLLDFNRSGFSLESCHQFIIGDVLVFAISIDNDTPVEIRAVICNRRKVEADYRYGVFFELGEKEDAFFSEAVLIKVESQLKENYTLFP